ncbi:MAG: ribose 5-phosphate isomerase B [Acidobacteriaceae bacterium]
MKVVIGADHAGFEMKQLLAEELKALGHTVTDVGTNSTAPVDYPDFAAALAKEVVEGRSERGVLICGSGVGASVAANKVKGIRAAICHDCYSAHQGVEHDDMNVIVFGARIIGIELAKDLMRDFLGAQFTHEERHQRRLNKILAMEKI